MVRDITCPRVPTHDVRSPPVETPVSAIQLTPKIRSQVPKSRRPSVTVTTALLWAPCRFRWASATCPYVLERGLPQARTCRWQAWPVQLRSRALKGQRFETLDELTETLNAALDYWNTRRHPYRWKKKPQGQVTLLGGFSVGPTAPIS